RDAGAARALLAVDAELRAILVGQFLGREELGSVRIGRDRPLRLLDGARVASGVDGAVVHLAGGEIERRLGAPAALAFLLGDGAGHERETVGNGPAFPRPHGCEKSPCLTLDISSLFVLTCAVNPERGSAGGAFTGPLFDTVNP